MSEKPLTISISEHGDLGSGYFPKTIMGDAALAMVMKTKTWSPIQFLDGVRDIAHFRVAEAVALDVDNKTGTPQCTIADARRHFAGFHAIIVPSKSHGIPKDGEPAVDRFHILFPQDIPIRSPGQYGEFCRLACAQFPFFDRGAASRAQMFFPSIMSGRSADTLPAVILSGVPFVPTGFDASPHAMTAGPAETAVRIRPDAWEPDPLGDAGMLSTPEAKAEALTALKTAAASGAFDERPEWVRLGMAMKASGYAVDDYVAVSWPAAAEDARASWSSFKPSTMGPGTVIHYARAAVPTLFKKAESSTPRPRQRAREVRDGGTPAEGPAAAVGGAFYAVVRARAAEINIRAALQGSDGEETGAVTTDTAAARMFVSCIQGAALYRRNLGWMLYNAAEGRWAYDAEAHSIVHAVIVMAEEVELAISGLADDAADDETVRKQGAKLVARLGSYGAIRAIVALAQTFDAVSTDPDSFDRDPALLNCCGTTVNLRTGASRPSTPEDRHSMTTAAPYDPEAHSPAWGQFLLSATEGGASQREPDKADVMRACLQRFSGYALSGYTNEQIALCLIGPASTGKSTFLGTIRAAMGNYARAVSPNIISTTSENTGRVDNELAELIGIRLAYCSELEEGSKLRESVFKSLVAGEEMKAEAKGKQPFYYYPTMKMVIGTNEIPVVKGDAGAVFRRFLLAGFYTRPETPDTHLHDTLSRELAGVLRWMIDGARGYFDDSGANPLAVPDEMNILRQRYQERADTIGLFMGEKLEKSDEPNAHALLKDVRAAYVEWAGGNARALSPKRFEQKLEEHGISIDRPYAGWGKVLRGWRLQVE